MLSILVEIVEDITQQKSSKTLTDNLYLKHNLIGFFALKLSCSDSAKKKSERKDIYAFIYSIALILFAISNAKVNIHELQANNLKRHFKKLIPQLGPAWTALVKAAQAD